MSDAAPEFTATDWTSDMWSSPDPDQTLVDVDCSPTKSCRNMVGVSFDGFAEPGTDLADAWRNRLQREGKLANGGATLRDLVLGDKSS